MDLSERGAGTTRHPWELARAAFFKRVLADHRVHARDVLDVGAGDGWLAAQMAFSGRVTLWDAHYTDDDLRALPNATRTKPSGAFDLVMLLDVLEHVDDASGTLREVLALAQPGAHVLVSVPAWPALWSSHDEQLDHRRRFRAKDARALLEGAGVALLEHGGVFHSLMVPRALEVVRERLLGPASSHGVGHWTRGAALARLVSGALEQEQRLARALSKRGVDVAGLTWWAIGTK